MDVIRVGGILLTGPHQAFGIEPKIYIVGSALLGLFKTFFLIASIIQFIEWSEIDLLFGAKPLDKRANQTDAYG